MQISDPSISKSHIVKRLKIRQQFTRATVSPGRLKEWSAVALCLSFVFGIIYLCMPTGNSADVFVLLLITVIVEVPIFLLLSFYVARTWRLTLDFDEAKCEHALTYFGFAYRRATLPLEDSFIGPCQALISWTEEKESVASVIGCLLLALLGPLGLLIGFLIQAARRSASNVRVVEGSFPAICHYHEPTDHPTIMLVLKKPEDRDRVLAAFAEIAPDSVSTE